MPRTPIEAAARRLLVRLQELSRLPGTPELSYHGQIEEFLRECTRTWSAHSDRAMTVLPEPQRISGVGGPDFLIVGLANNSSDPEGCYALVEAKPLNVLGAPDVVGTAIAAQLRRYRALGVPLVVTDGISYSYYPAGQEDPIVLGDLVRKPMDVDTEWRNLRVDWTVLSQLQASIATQGFRPIARDELLSEAASRAKAIRVRLQQNLERFVPGAARSAEERITMERLVQLQRALSQGYDSVLSAPGIFASFLAQIVAFGVLIAHDSSESHAHGPTDLGSALEGYWRQQPPAVAPERLPLFTAVMRLISAAAEDDWLHEACSNMVRWASFLKVIPPPREPPRTYVELYEEFLSRFDPSARRDYGVYYTEPEAIEFAVAASESVARSLRVEELLYSVRSHIIDPCSGTAGFVERLAQSAQRFEGLRTSSPITATAAGDEELLQICGIEILPAPYALAQERIARLPRQERCSIELALANTLSDQLDSTVCDSFSLDGISTEYGDLVFRERSRASRLARRPITWIIGNPPSSDSLNHMSSPQNPTRLDVLLEDFRPPPAERTGRSNVQRLIRNEWVKFLRWSCDRVLRSDLGLLSLYLPSTIVGDVSSKYVRMWLLQHFSEMWILEIDQDLRMRQGASQSLFRGVQPGRVLLIALSRGNQVPSHACGVHFITIASKPRAEKARLLMSSELPALLASSTAAVPQAPDYRLDSTPVQSVSSPPSRGNTRYYWPLYRPPSGYAGAAIFERTCSGVKLAPSNLLVHADRLMLSRRTQELARRGADLNDELNRWFAGQPRPPQISQLTPEVRVALGHAAAATVEVTRRYTYRPFVPVWLLYSPEILASLAARPRSGTRNRPELLAAFGDPSTRAIAVAPSSAAIGAGHLSLAAFCHCLPDNDMVARGSARIVCDRFPEYQNTRERHAWDPSPHDNLSARFRDAFDGDTAPESLQTLHYCYAVLSSHWYNESAVPRTGELGGVAVPLVPVLRDLSSFNLVSDYGRDLSDLENPELPVDMPQELEDMVNSQVTIAEDLRSFKVVEQSPGASIVLRDARGNEFMRLGPIDATALGEKIGGYDVWKTWLKYRTAAYLSRPFNVDDLRDLARLCMALQRRRELLAEIDSVLRESAATDDSLLPTN